MEGPGVNCVLWALLLSMAAEAVVGSPDGNGRPKKSEGSEGAASHFSISRPVREGELLQLSDHVMHGDALLKERLQNSYSDLKELVNLGDAALKERMSEGQARVKEQLKDGDDRLKEELDQDVAWLKDRLTRAEVRAKEDLAKVTQELSEQRKKRREELKEQTEDFRKLQDSVRAWTQESGAVMDDLRQQVTAFQVDLNSTRHQLLTVVTKLGALQSVQDELTSTQETVQSLTAEVNRLQTSQRPLDSSGMTGKTSNFTDSGSTFTRWGRTSCPDNTSLVYSGVAGGTWWNHIGGASNYLCLGMEPQLDDPPASLNDYVNYLYGAEYQSIPGHHDQDVVCCVCRAPQATTLMIPATRACPAVWTAQYKGHLVSAHHDEKGKTEYVCLDEVREHRVAGHANNNGANVFHVLTRCGSLPCPPYVGGKLVTCVVCSL